LRPQRETNETRYLHRVRKQPSSARLFYRNRVRYPQYHIRAGKPCACSRLIPSPTGREGWANHVRRSKHSRAIVRSVLGVSSYSLVIDKQTTQLNQQNLLDVGNQESYISEHITYRNVS
jgi:hypothetical protein